MAGTRDAGPALMSISPFSPAKERIMNPGHKPPRTWGELHALAMASGSAFPRQLALLVDFALQHPDIMAFGTCSSIARRAGVSATTVSRLAGVLGYRSFRDLRTLFRDDLVRRGGARSLKAQGKAVRQRTSPGRPAQECQGRS
ncbi:MurR/RpiR family transcriptional regulator [Shinella yambaruensis]|nr:MurR/RpiR family transcriptional regulator [Shinella yambaruensis]MCJ8028142.1 MurR/RpiR family transcriptional regulator [Shinella yambaruensis]MCU7980376.1 MurR/RpiR family transcriptional regulator [Shinella yambaruensis]